MVVDVAFKFLIIVSGSEARNQKVVHQTRKNIRTELTVGFS